MAASVVSAGKVRNRPTGTLNLGTYATGGVAVSASLFGHPSTLSDLWISPVGGYHMEYVPSTSKVKAYVYSTRRDSLTEVANTTSLSSVNVPFRSRGY